MNKIKGIIGILGDIHAVDNKLILDKMPAVSSDINKKVDILLENRDFNRNDIEWIQVGDVFDSSLLTGEEVQAANQFCKELGPDDKIHLLEGNHDISNNDNHAILAMVNHNKYLKKMSVINLFDRNILMMPWLYINTQQYYEDEKNYNQFKSININYAFGHFSDKITSGWGFDLSNIPVQDDHIFLGHDHIKSDKSIKRQTGCILTTAKNQTDAPIIQFIIIYEDDTIAVEDEIITMTLTHPILYKEIEYYESIVDDIKKAETNDEQVTFWEITKCPPSLKSKLLRDHPSIKKIYTTVSGFTTKDERKSTNGLNILEVIKRAKQTYVKQCPDKNIKKQLKDLLL